MLGDAVVDQPRPERVAELVGGHAHGLAGLVMQHDAVLPVRQPRAEGGVGEWPPPAGVAVRGGEQPRRWAVWPPQPQVGLLGADGLGGPGGQRHELFGLHLVVEELQAGPADRVVDDRVERQRARVVGPQPGLDDQHEQVSGGVVGQQREMIRTVDLGHHELGDEPGQRLWSRRELVEIDRGCGRQIRHPAIATAGFQEAAQAHQQPVGRVARHAPSAEPGQVVLEHDSAQVAGCADGGMLFGEEPR